MTKLGGKNLPDINFLNKSKSVLTFTVFKEILSLCISNGRTSGTF